MPRNAHRAIARERVYGPGPTPTSRVLLAKKGGLLPPDRDVDDPAPDADASGVGDSVPTAVNAGSIPKLRKDLDDAAGIGPEAVADLAAAIRAAELRSEFPRKGVLALCDAAEAAATQ